MWAFIKRWLMGEFHPYLLLYDVTIAPRSFATIDYRIGNWAPVLKILAHCAVFILVILNMFIRIFRFAFFTAWLPTDNKIAAKIRENVETANRKVRYLNWSDDTSWP